MNMKKSFVLWFFSAIIFVSCTPKAFRVSRPNFTLLKESSQYVGGLLGNPNDENGHYIILNNNLQTYMSHTLTSDEVGIWRMRGDTLILEPQLFTMVNWANPGKYVDCSATRRSRQFIMSDRYAYDITDYSINSPDSLFTTPAYEGQITQINKWLNDSREVFLIMQSSYPYKYQRSYEW